MTNKDFSFKQEGCDGALIWENSKTIKRYQQLCNERSAIDTAKFDIFWAFSNQQFADGLKSIRPLKDGEKLVRIGAGGFGTHDGVDRYLNCLHEYDARIKEDVNGVSFLPVHVKDIDMQELMNLGDQLKAKLGDGVILLASENGGKVSLLAMATDGAMKKGAHAGNLIKAVAKLVGGGGGGRPNMAQAGGKNPAGINQALEAGAEELAKQLH